MSPEKRFTVAQRKAIVEAIKKAEQYTSGEIRVHIENNCKGNVLDRAANVFATLKMHKTAQRNGVLFYLALNDKKFAILGDAGINAKVPTDFWESVRNKMTQHFKENHITEGICSGVLSAGEQLQYFFPHAQDDVNELSDEISFE